MKFVEIDSGFCINFDKVISIAVNSEYPDWTDVLLDGGEKYVAHIQYSAMKTLLNSGVNDLQKFVKQIAANQRYPVP